MLSPQVSVTSPSGANLPATTTTSSSTRRRGLSYLRGLSQNRTSITSSPESPRTSPRNYFVRSTSYNETRGANPEQNRHRSSSRPNEPTRSLLDAAAIASPATNPNTPARSQPAAEETRGARSSERQEESPSQPPTAESPESDDMARHRTSGSRRSGSIGESQDTRLTEVTSTENAAGQDSTRNPTSRMAAMTNGDGTESVETKQQPPTIRFYPHQEIRNGRQSLNFTPVSRTLPSESSILRVGRYSEREGIPTSNPTTPSDAPVGFKSKVVSRKHCEFSFVSGQWHVKDVASSSGTFLNHIRLSQPNVESRLFPVKDGDILQLGIDFRGGEEMIFRCVKIRIECNRSWQKKPNTFNKNRHAQLQSLAKDQPAASNNSNECSICLGSVLPCQSLFVAPCAHVWHYKCIRPLLEGKNSTYPQFQCPNCRAYSDLSADVDVAPDEMDEWMDNAEDGPETNDEDTGNDPGALPNGESAASLPTPTAATSETPAGASAVPNDVVGDPLNTPQAENSTTAPSMSSSGLLARRQAANPTSPKVNSVIGIDMPDRHDRAESNESSDGHLLQPEKTRTGSPDPDQIIAGEGPLTPRNNAGPFVFDGSAGRADGSTRRLIVTELERDLD